MKNFLIPVLGIVLLWSNVGSAQEKWTAGRPDGHAPVGVMGDHYHGKGEVMFSYRFMPMWMKSNLKGDDEVDDESLLQEYMVSPREMQMNMHMLGMMYAVSDNVTLMGMVNYISNAMELQTRMGDEFTTRSSGFGDVSVAALVKLLNKNSQSVHAKIGLSLPTGSITESDNTPMMAKARLGYPMQLGSGSFDPLLGITYLGQAEGFSWGAQTQYRLRTGENDQSYSLGDRFDLTGWVALKASKNLSFSARGSYWNLGEIGGRDDALNPMMMPLMNASNSGREQLDLGLGANFYIPSGAFKNLRLGIEALLPVYQDVKGIQMKNELSGVLGIQYSFGGHHHE